MDWNWFFSSFSQSAAAIIAIIGAYVITRFLELKKDHIFEINKIKENERKRDSLIWDLIKNKKLIKKDIEMKIRQYFAGNIQLFKNSQPPETPFNWDNLNLYKETFKETFEDPNCINIDEFSNQIQMKLISKREIEKEYRFRYEFFFDSTAPIELANTAKLQEYKIDLIERRNINFFQNAENITLDIRKSSYMCRYLKDAKKRLTKILFGLNLALILFVAYPLHFLPVNTSKTFLITFIPSEIFDSIFDIKGFFIILFVLFFIVFSISLFWSLKDIDKSLDYSIKMEKDFNMSYFTEIDNFEYLEEPPKIKSIWDIHGLN